MVRDEDFVAGPKAKRSQNGIHSGSCVRHEDQIVSLCSHKPGESSARFIEHRFEFPNHERDRLAFQSQSKLILIIENRFRARAERAVVQENDLRIKPP
jgi:hypothetical protein